MTMPSLAIHRSRKLIPPFRLLRPRAAAEAAALQAETQVEAPGGAVFMAGGIDLINRLKFGAPVETVIHLGAVAGLGEIVETETGLTIGAGVTHDQLQTSPAIRARLPTLAETWGTVGNIRVRLKGTVGGNLMARDPAYDFAPAVMAAGAQLRFVAAEGAVRRIPASGLSDAAGRPAPQAGLLTAIELPRPATLRLEFDRSLRPALSLAIGLDLEGELDTARVVGGRVAIGCAFAAPMARALPLAGPLTLRELGRVAGDVAHALAAGLPEPATDNHASAAYRRRMVEVLLRRGLVALAEPSA
jgi:aerobic carbon-monoxide dehydrogenase medium subunit